MKQVLGVVLAGGLLLITTYILFFPGERQQGTVVTPQVVIEEMVPASGVAPEVEVLPESVVLDVSVHTIEGLKVLFDRAEQLAMAPRPGGGDASVVLVLHGPEVDFFSIKNYHKYKDIVDQAARLDAFDVVDVRICQTMIGMRGIDRTDIPSFIEQVPYGPREVERLKEEGYVTF